MSSTNVFGKAITAVDYPEREARASAAYTLIDADEKKTQVRAYVKKLKDSYGDGISVLAMLYNATGESIHFSTSKDWYGKLYTDGGSSYPKIIQNGQWGGFLHIKSPVVTSGSEAAVVYRAKPCGPGSGGDGGADVVIAWDNSWSPGSNNRVYTEIAEGGRVMDSGNWDEIKKKLESKSASESGFGMGLYSTLSIAQDSSPFLESVLTST